MAGHKDAERVITPRGAFRTWAVAGLISMVVATGCGATQGTAAKPPSALPPTSASPAVAWQSYVEPDWAYSLSVPVDWHEVTNGEWHSVNTDNALLDKFTRSFSNEAIAHAGDLPLDGRGIDFQIIVIPSAACSPPDVATSTIPPAGISVDGSTGTMVAYDYSDSGQPYQSVFIQAGFGKYCFVFLVFTLSIATRDSFVPIFKMMLATFKLGTPVAPPF
jgi:hypothetical protein